MNVQTRGEFEESLAHNGIFKCFVFIHYKGRWIESLVIDNGDRIVYFHAGSDSVYLAECILKVYKPESPDKLQIFIDEFEKGIRQNQKEKSCEAIKDFFFNEDNLIKARTLIMEVE